MNATVQGTHGTQAIKPYELICAQTEFTQLSKGAEFHSWPFCNELCVGILPKNWFFVVKHLENGSYFQAQLRNSALLWRGDEKKKRLQYKFADCLIIMKLFQFKYFPEQQNIHFHWNFFSGKLNPDVKAELKLN